MPNLIRGEVQFKAAGREMFLAYGTPEIAEAQAALGYHRPDPAQPTIAEEMDEPILERGKPKLDEHGAPMFRRVRVLVDAEERQRRMIAGFEATLMNPDPVSLLTLIRVGLGPWERKQQTPISDAAFEQIVREMGMVRLKTVHFQAISFGSYLSGEEEPEGKAPAAASASST